MALFGRARPLFDPANPAKTSPPGALDAAKLNYRNRAAPLAPGPTTAGLAPPAPPTVLPGANEAAAQVAGLKARKRAAAGSILTRPTAPVSSAMPVGARTTPRSLIGGY